MIPPPLDGLTVLELSSFVAAPLGGMTLAQLGATVIRIDPVGGGPDANRWPLAPSGASLYWTGLNKGKQSVTLNLRAPEGQQLLRGLLAASGSDGGILLTNSPARGWLSHDELSKVRPDLIHLQIRGHRDGRAAVDYTVNAATGFPLITGPEELGSPVNHVLPAWDVACGLYAAAGLLAAERRRQRAGVGSAITLALADVALAVAGHLGFLAEAQVTGTERPRIGNHLFGGLGRDFQTADGERVMVDIAGSGSLAENPLLQPVNQPGVGPVLAPLSPLIMESLPGARPAPVLGADTQSVLSSFLGLTPADISELTERGIIGTASSEG